MTGTRSEQHLKLMSQWWHKNKYYLYLHSVRWTTLYLIRFNVLDHSVMQQQRLADGSKTQIFYIHIRSLYSRQFTRTSQLFYAVAAMASANAYDFIVLSPNNTESSSCFSSSCVCMPSLFVRVLGCRLLIYWASNKHPSHSRKTVSFTQDD